MKNYLIILSSIFFFSNYSMAQQTITPWMGVNIEDHKQGVLVKSAIPDQPAHKAGFQTGDIITKVDKTAMKSAKELVEYIRGKGVGHKVTVYYLKNGKKESKTDLALVAKPGILEIVEKNLLNQKAPNIKTKVLMGKMKGKDFDLHNHKGVKIIEFWATWCGACNQAHPVIKEWAKKHKDKVTIVAISDEPNKMVKKFLHKKAQNGQIGEDVPFLAGDNTDINRNYFVPALPMFVLVDEKNIVRAATIGTGVNLEEIFQKALNLTK